MAMGPDTPPSLPPFPSFTKTYHNKSYAAISPLARPSLSVAGKHVVITGGGTGIGKAIALGFAEACASSISILGRRLDRLHAASATILARVPSAKVFVYSADLADRASTHDAFEQIAQRVGKIDIFVSNAGVYADGPVATADVDEFMRTFEGNVRGALNAFQAFIPHAAAGAYLLSTSTGIAHVAPMFPQAAYAASKVANVKLVEAIAAEHPELHVVQIQPGVVATEMNGNFNMDEGMSLATAR